MTDSQFQQLIGILGQVGNSAYQAAMLRAMVEGTTSFFGWLILLIVSLTIIQRLWKWADKTVLSQDSNFSEYDVQMVKVLSGVGGGFVCMIIFFGVVNGLTMALTPQFSAIKLLADLVK